MNRCPHCGVEIDTKSCYNCGYPHFRPEPKESETRKWSNFEGYSPDGRLIESCELYQILAKIGKPK